MAAATESQWNCVSVRLKALRKGYFCSQTCSLLCQLSQPWETLYLQDKDAKFHLILVESRIHRLARYYKKTKKLPPNWKYESATASALVA